ncbi:MAG: DUF21 domain-containing protein [bacterium]
MKSRIIIISIFLLALTAAFIGLNIKSLNIGSWSINPKWFSWVIFLTGYAVCSGANVSYFALSRRDLRKIIWRGRNASPESKALILAKRAKMLMGHLKNPNWTLAAILLTNVGFGVYLSQLSDVLFIGVLGIIMPVISITIIGEFFAQATFLRYAGVICYLFSPLIWLLKWITSPVSYPLAKIIDSLYGREAIRHLEEPELLSELEMELKDWRGEKNDPSDRILDPRELKTLMNAARADDELASEIGQPLDPRTIIPLKFEQDNPCFPPPRQFIEKYIAGIKHPWFVITNKKTGYPKFILDADGFVRNAFVSFSLKQDVSFNPLAHSFRVEVYDNPEVKLGEVVDNFLVHAEHPDDDVIDIDVALIWTNQRKWIITGGDVLGRLLKGVANKFNIKTEAASQGLDFHGKTLT